MYSVEEMEKILKCYMAGGAEGKMEAVFDESKPYVFISYSHASTSKEKVYNLLVRLMKEGINFAIDTDFSGHSGNWIESVDGRIEAKECKCMMSFYCDEYLCSVPSLLEQLCRFTGYAKDDHGGEPVPNIYISLYEDKNIKSHIGQVKEKLRTNVASMDDKEEIMREGLIGVFGADRTRMVEKALEHIRKGTVARYFAEIATSKNCDHHKWNNANKYNEYDSIISMLEKDFSVSCDEEIKKKCDVIFAEYSKTQKKVTAGGRGEEVEMPKKSKDKEMGEERCFLDGFIEYHNSVKTDKDNCLELREMKPGERKEKAYYLRLGVKTHAVKISYLKNEWRISMRLYAKSLTEQEIGSLLPKIGKVFGDSVPTPESIMASQSMLDVCYKKKMYDPIVENDYKEMVDTLYEFVEKLIAADLIVKDVYRKF